MLEDCPAPPPYWSKYEDKQERCRAVAEFKKIQREKQYLTQLLHITDKAVIDHKI